MKETFELNCPRCVVGVLTYNTLKGVEYYKKHNVICKQCKKKIKNEKKTLVYKRNCPECGVELITNNKYWNELALKENKICLSCSNKKHVFTEEWKNNLKKNHADFTKEKNPFYGKTHDEKIINKLREINLGVDRFTDKYKKELKNKMSGKGNPFYGKTHKKETKEKLRNITEQLRKLRRENRLKQIKDSGGIPSFNYNACIYFEKLSKEKEWNLQHALNGGEVVINGYSVDAYDKIKNIIVEYDESHHYNIETGELKLKDRKRQERIIKYCGCRFFRYNEKENTLYEVK